MFDASQLSRCISRHLGELKDKQLEAKFIRHETDGTPGQIRPVVLALGILFFLFIIPDYLTQSSQTFRVILLIRGSFLFLVCLLYLRLRLPYNYHFLTRWVSVYKVIASASFFLIFYFYESPGFLIQSFGVVALILAFFLVTNRWLYDILISVFLSIGFILIANYRFEYIPPLEFAAVGVYITLVLLISGISSLRINYYKRMQYLYSQQLKRASEIDALTGIYVKAKFNEELDKWLELADRYGHALSLVLFDVDDFKKINDAYGHVIGERVLVTLAGIVKNAIRKSDIFARWGGDEFAIIFPHTGELQAYKLAERIRAVIASHCFEAVGSVSCSFGLEVYQKDDDSSSFLSRADQKLYQAKRAGKNLVM